MSDHEDKTYTEGGDRRLIRVSEPGATVSGSPIVVRDGVIQRGSGSGVGSTVNVVVEPTDNSSASLVEGIGGEQINLGDLVPEGTAFDPFQLTDDEHAEVSPPAVRQKSVAQSDED